MHSSDQDIQDQRKSNGIEDSTSMTIEFLRARLLSERSVSRTAKQRADELSKRVAELEEQLKIVSLQRKKAEKAAVDVLAILERQDVSDLSEDYDSSSDQETPLESAEGATSFKEDESSVNSKVRRNESEDFSGSEHDYSSVSGGRLSWKGRKGSSRSGERFKHSSMRRQSSLTSTGSSPKHLMGKSCRQIRRRDPRSVSEESNKESTKIGAQENGVATSSNGFQDFSDGGRDILQGGTEIQEEEVSACLENQRNTTNGGPDLSGYGRDKDMERALEHQAQLIGQYEEMEKAQREWEEKFRENNNSTPDSCDHGNHSDITEEREEIKARAPSHAGIATTQISQAQEVKSQAEDVCFSKELSKSKPNGFQQPSDIDTRYLPDQEGSSMRGYKSPAREFEFPMAKGRNSQENPGNYHNSPLHGSDHQGHSLVSHSAHESSSSQPEASGNRNDLYALVPHQKTEELGDVLEALKHARLSLQHKINVNGLPLTEGGTIVKANPSIPATKTMDRAEIPVGCAGLFRLPTDYLIESHTPSHILGSGPQLSSSNCYPHRAINFGEQRFLASPYMDVRPSYMDTRPSFSTDDRFLTSRYMDVGSRVPAQTQKPYFDPRLDTGLPSSSRLAHPAYSSYPDAMLQMPSSDGLSRPVPSGRTFGMLPEDHYAYYDDQIRPNMYR